MSAPLRRAAESGRLHIYPIDLRSAAARRLQEQAGTAPAGGGIDDRFDQFLSDLFSYLNSVDYLVEFISDSIRQSGKISDEIVGLCSSETVDGIEQHRDQLETELNRRGALLASAETADQVDWEAAARAPLEHLQAARAEARAASLSEIDSGVRALAGAWLDSDQSLQQLKQSVRDTVSAALVAYREQAGDGIRTTVAASFGGAELEEAAAAAVKALELEFPGLPDATVAAFDTVPEGGDAEPALDDIPIHRTFGDLLLFRSADSIRRKIIGDPNQELPARVKETRFTTEAAQYIREAASAAVAAGIDKAEQSYRDATQQYATGFAEGTGKQLAARIANLKKESAALETEKSALGAVTAQIRKLAEVAAATRDGTASLEEKHRHTVKRLKSGAAPTGETGAGEAPASDAGTG